MKHTPKINKGATMLKEKQTQEDIFTEMEAADYIKMSRSFLRHHRQHGFISNKFQGPKYIKIGRTIRYLKDDLNKWLLSHRKEPTVIDMNYL